MHHMLSLMTMIDIYPRQLTTTSTDEPFDDQHLFTSTMNHYLTSITPLINHYINHLPYHDWALSTTYWPLILSNHLYSLSTIITHQPTISSSFPVVALHQRVAERFNPSPGSSWSPDSDRQTWEADLNVAVPPAGRRNNLDKLKIISGYLNY